LRVLKVEEAVECKVLRRLNRFVVEVIADGKRLRAHINNTGRLSEFLVMGKRAFCTSLKRPRKTDCRLFAVEDRNLGAIIDIQLQMRAFERTLNGGFIPWLRGARILKRNPKLGGAVLDYLLEIDGEELYLEVKSAVLRGGKGGRYAMYPDCPSLRGRNQIRELIGHVRNGGRGTVLFIAALPMVAAFKPNGQADLEMRRLLLKARSAGVDIKAVGLYYDPQDQFVYLYNSNLEVAL